MITKDMVKVKHKEDGLYLSAKTKNGSYGQFYNTVNPTTPSYMASVGNAIDDFIVFYNQFE